MVKVVLVRKVSSAADRSKDRLYALECKLPAVPRAGDRMNLPQEQGVDIDSVEYRPDSPLVLIRLHADHRNFKANDKAKHFHNSWTSYELAGWQEIKTKELRLWTG